MTTPASDSSAGHHPIDARGATVEIGAIEVKGARRFDVVVAWRPPLAVVVGMLESTVRWQERRLLLETPPVALTKTAGRRIAAVARAAVGSVASPAAAGWWQVEVRLVAREAQVVGLEPGLPAGVACLDAVHPLGLGGFGLTAIDAAGLDSTALDLAEVAPQELGLAGPGSAGQQGLGCAPPGVAAAPLPAASGLVGTIVADGIRLAPGQAIGHAVQVCLGTAPVGGDLSRAPVDPGLTAAPLRRSLCERELPWGPGVTCEPLLAPGSPLGEGEPPGHRVDLLRLTAHGADRAAALARLRQAVARSFLRLDDGASDKAPTLGLLARPELLAGPVDDAWFPQLVARAEHLPRDGAEIALLVGAVLGYEDSVDEAKRRFLASADRGRPQAALSTGWSGTVWQRGEPYACRVAKLAPEAYRVAVDGATITLQLALHGDGRGRCALALPPADDDGARIRGDGEGDGSVHSVRVVRNPGAVDVEIDGVPHRVVGDPATLLRSPMPAIVSQLRVAAGDTIVAAAPLVVLEAMKLETTLVAERAGRIRQVLVRAYDQVGEGDPLLILEPPELADPAIVGKSSGRSSAGRLSLGALAGAVVQGGDEGWGDGEGDRRQGDGNGSGHGNGEGEEKGSSSRPARRSASEVGRQPAKAAIDWADAPARRLFLGYDEDGGVPAGSPLAPAQAPWQGEDEPLWAYVDVLSLFRPQPAEELRDELARSVEEYLFTYLRDLGRRGAGLPPAFLDKLRHALAHYGVHHLEPGPALAEALFRLTVAHHRRARLAGPALALLERWLARPLPADAGELTLLDRLIIEARDREPAVSDLAREVRYRRFDEPRLAAERAEKLARVDALLEVAAAAVDPGVRRVVVAELVDWWHGLHAPLTARIGDPRGDRLGSPHRGQPTERIAGAEASLRQLVLEILVRRYYRIRTIGEVTPLAASDFGVEASAAVDMVIARYRHADQPVLLLAVQGEAARLAQLLALVGRVTVDQPAVGTEIVADLYLRGQAPDVAALAAEVAAARLPAALARVAVAVATGNEVRTFTFRRSPGGGELVEDALARGLHPMIARRLQLWRLSHFALERLPSSPGLHVLFGRAHDNPRDQRLFVLTEVRDLTLVRDAAGHVVALPQLERTLLAALAELRRVQARRPVEERLQWNRIVVDVWPVLELAAEELGGIVERLARHAQGLGLAKVAVRCRLPEVDGGAVDRVLEITRLEEGQPTIRLRRPSEQPLSPLDPYARRVGELRQRGLPYPYEIVRTLLGGPGSGGGSAGARPEDANGSRFVEYDLDPAGELVAVDRPWGENRANVVVGVISRVTTRYPEGMMRVILLGDAARGMGALAEPECRRILAGLELAERLALPVEWFALSAGAKIAMDSGTENMDWIARVLRRLVEATQRGLEVNIVIAGITVGAQPYWNAEATMLMHTRGILVMTPEGAMVLTGKRALDYSGGVSAEDNFGIGGYQRVMGPNGQAQYFAPDLPAACRILLAHYEHAYVAPGERFPRRAASADPSSRDIRDAPHGGEWASTVGEVFSDAANPARKRPFDIRRVMAAVADQDHPPLERWPGMRDGEVAVVWDAQLGGWPITLLGIESHLLRRVGWVPAYGPGSWTGGTLFPQASRKVARAINAASGSRPLVVLANLSGFDGSPESMLERQLEYGAEIGRAVVNFRGPIVFVVISRYHGGAFVVFSGALHDNMQVAALEGTFASVIGGTPAAAVVFAREVEKRASGDPRVAAIESQLAAREATDRAALLAERDELLAVVRAEKLGEVAVEYDRVHSIERALRVGSVHEILPPASLRPWLIAAVERGIARELATWSARGRAESAPAPPGGRQ